MNNTNISSIIQSDIAKKSLNVVGSISEWVRVRVEYVGITFTQTLSTILTIFIAVLLMWLGTRVANKILKGILIVLGLLLIIGTGYVIIGRMI